MRYLIGVLGMFVCFSNAYCLDLKEVKYDTTKKKFRIETTDDKVIYEHFENGDNLYITLNEKNFRILDELCDKEIDAIYIDNLIFRKDKKSDYYIIRGSLSETFTQEEIRNLFSKAQETYLEYRSLFEKDDEFHKELELKIKKFKEDVLKSFD